MASYNQTLDEAEEENDKERKRQHVVVHYLPLLVDDGNCVLQLDIVEETCQENIGHADQAVVLLLIEEWISTLEIGAHHLRTDGGRRSGAAHST